MKVQLIKAIEQSSEAIEKFLEILNDAIIAKTYFGFRFAVIIFSGLLFIAIVIILIKSIPYLKETWLEIFRGTDVPTYPKGKMRRKWEAIQRRMRTRKDSNYKLAVIEADNMLNNILEASGFPGKNMEERLKILTSDQFSNLENIKQAHKLRNKIIHDMDSEIKLSKAEQAIETYRIALDSLEAI